jgi:hypothetical protein
VQFISFVTCKLFHEHGYIQQLWTI